MFLVIIYKWNFYSTWSECPLQDDFLVVAFVVVAFHPFCSLMSLGDKNMVGEGVLCKWLLWGYHSWFYNPLNYDSTCSWNARWHRNLSISRRDQLRPRLPHTWCCTSMGLEDSPEVLTPIMSTKWKISVFMMPAASRGLTNWGKLFVLGSCLFAFTQSERFFFGFDLFATRCFQGQLIVENYIFSPIKYDAQQHSYSHTGAFIHPREKSTFKYEVGSSWCPVLLPLKSMGGLPAT